MIESKGSVWKTAFDTFMTYVLWFVVIVLALWCLVSARGAINIMYILLTWNRWVLRAVDRWSLLFFGILWLIGVIASEEYLRRGAEKGDLYRRFTKIAGSEVLLGIFFTLLQTVG